MNSTKLVAREIPGYNYGSAEIAQSPITPQELEQLKQSAGFIGDDEHWLQRWRSSCRPDQSVSRKVARRYLRTSSSCKALSSSGRAKRSNLLGGQRIAVSTVDLDTCFRPYYQDWLNYQQEIALRHTRLKNKTDHAESVPTIHLRDTVAFTAIINDPNILKPLLSAKGHGTAEIDKMHQAWCKSVLLQIALWTEPYTNAKLAPNKW